MVMYYLPITLITFLIWGIDKQRAKSGQWRVPERWLVALVLLGGALGGLAGMLIFRHKTRKKGFWVLISIGLIIHIAVFFWLGWLENS